MNNKVVTFVKNGIYGKLKFALRENCVKKNCWSRSRNLAQFPDSMEIEIGQRIGQRTTKLLLYYTIFVLSTPQRSQRWNLWNYKKPVRQKSLQFVNNYDGDNQNPLAFQFNYSNVKTLLCFMY